MNKIEYLFPGGVKKVFTLSYDDGVKQDKRLVSTFNRNRIKATFNLNSGIQSEENTWINKGIIISRLNKEDVLNLYNGHEVAVHSLTHPPLENLSRETIVEEIFEDRKNLEKIFGYPVRGMAYPFGSYNKQIFEILDVLGIEYSRTVDEHDKFMLPENYLEWNPTCHHNNPKLMQLAKDFVENQFNTLSLFYVWGHSYEFDVDNNWELIEEFSEFMANRKDIWYATNIEIVDYVKALKNLKVSADSSLVYNLSSFNLWISVNEKPIVVKAGEVIKVG